MTAHTCHAFGCETRVPPKLFMCKPHWSMVPVELQRRIWGEYRLGQERDKQPSVAYLRTALEAVRTVAEKEGK